MSYGFYQQSPPELSGVDSHFISKTGDNIHVEISHRGASKAQNLIHRVMQMNFNSATNDMAKGPRKTRVIVPYNWLMKAGDADLKELAEHVAHAESGKLGVEWENKEGNVKIMSESLSADLQSYTEVSWYPNASDIELAIYEAKSLIRTRINEKADQLRRVSPSIAAVDVRPLMPRPVSQSNGNNYEVCRRFIREIEQGVIEALANNKDIKGVLLWIPRSIVGADLQYLLSDDVVFILPESSGLENILTTVAVQISSLNWLQF